MSAENDLNIIECTIKENPYYFYKANRRAILLRAGNVQKEIESLRRFAMLKPGRVQEIVLSKAAFLEDRLNELLTSLKGV